MTYEPQSLTEYILESNPDVGDEFIVRVLDGDLNTSRCTPWLRVYIRRSGRDSETKDFRISYEWDEPWQEEDPE